MAKKGTDYKSLKKPHPNDVSIAPEGTNPEPIVLLLKNDYQICDINTLGATELFQKEKRCVINQCIITLLNEQHFNLVEALDDLKSNRDQLFKNITLENGPFRKKYNTTIIAIDEADKTYYAITLVPCNDPYHTYINSIIDNLPGAVYWKDRKGHYMGCNTFVANMAGYDSSEKMIGKTDYDLCWREFAKDWQQLDNKVIQENTTIVREEKAKLANGKIITELTYKTPLKNEQDEIIGVIGTSLDITDRKEMEQKLREAKITAEAATRAKAAFIANMSHDLRTPLSGIIGLSTMIESSTDNPAERENAHWIHDSGEQLLILLNGILDVVAAENLGEDHIHNESFDLRKFIEGIVQLELPTTKSKKLDLQVNIDNKVPTYIISDRIKLHRILLNLLGNAIKFTKTGSVTIEVTILDNSAADVHLQFDVADTGIGIPLELQDKVFDRFYRVTPSYKGTYAGHGIGLDIAQSYVNLLGGHITLTSQEGVGTTFHFDLPCKIGNKEDTLPPKTAMFVDEESNNPLTPMPVNDATTNEASLLSNNVPSILLVEDNPIALKVIESLVTTTGCQFESAINGEHAFELATTHNFDLILTDIGLPGISGHEFTQRFREWEKTQHKKHPMPVIGLTAHARNAAIKECLLCGMDDVLSKPANLAMIQRMLEEYHIKDRRIAAENIQVCNEPKPGLPGKLGKSLPDTEKELFEIDSFLIFSPEYALEQTQNETLLYEQLNLFISDNVQQDIYAMTMAYEKKDWGIIGKLAHKFKGGAGYLGLHRMVYACQYLEHYYKKGDPNQKVLDKLYHQTMRVNEETIKTIRSWLNRSQ